MADRFSNSVVSEAGIPFDQWMKNNVHGKQGLLQGQLVECFDINGDKIKRPLGSVGLLIEECKFMRSDSTSNCVTGNPIMFVDILSVFPEVYLCTRKGILSNTRSVYLIPLALLEQSSDLINFVEECFAEFVAQRRGNVHHDPTHIANGACSILAAICFQLSQEITLNGKNPDIQRMIFLVEAFNNMSHMLFSAATHYPEVDRICRLMPYVANSADNLQSILMSFLFAEDPVEGIVVKQFASSIFRYFKYSGWNTSYVDKSPVGKIALLLVVPMLSELISPEYDPTEIINIIVGTINTAILDIVKKFKETDFDKLSRDNMAEHKECQFSLGRNPYSPINLQNKQILLGFANATKKKLIRPELIEVIYDAVLHGERDVAGYIGVSKLPPFVRTDTEIILNKGDRCTIKNFPVVVKNEGRKVSFVPANPLEWSSLLLRNGEYEVIAKNIGIGKFEIGDTQNKRNIANYRLTFGDHESIMFGGKFDGYSASGMFYDSEHSIYRERPLARFDPNQTFTVISGDNNSGMRIIQNGSDILLIGNKGNISMSPLFCFKYCLVEISCVRLIEPQKEPLHPDALVREKFSYSDAVRKPIVPTPPVHPIPPCLSLTDSLQEFKVKDTGRIAYGAQRRKF
jgi:hypothetical protein